MQIINSRLLIILAAFITFGTFSAASTALSQIENDLDYGTYRTVADVFSVRVPGTDEKKLFVSISNPYTNTIVCSGRITYGVVEGFATKITKTLYLDKSVVFPNGAFKRPQLDDVEVELNEGQRLDLGFKGPSNVTCVRMDLSTPLPRQYCEHASRIELHENGCSMLYEGQKIYPLVSDNYLLGSCKCYE